MPAWLSLPRISASRSKRFTSAGRRLSRRRNLSATSRRGRSCSARTTTPMPPRPSSRMIVKPGTLSFGIGRSAAPSSSPARPVRNAGAASWWRRRSATSRASAGSSSHSRARKPARSAGARATAASNSSLTLAYRAASIVSSSEEHDDTRLAGRLPARLRLALGLELAPCLLQLLLARALEVREVELELLQPGDDGLGHEEAREPLVVGGHDEPGRDGAAGALDRGGPAPLVLVPVPALGHVARVELPVLLGVLDALEEAALLLLPRDVQEELAHEHGVPREVALERGDVLHALVPDRLRDAARRQALLLEELGVDAHRHHLLVVGAVEDADAPALRQRARGAPQEVVVELLGRGRLEREHLAAGRVDAREHVLDDAVLAGRVHALEEEQRGPAVLRVETLLQLAQALDAVRQARLGRVLADPARVARIDVGELEALARLDEELPRQRGVLAHAQTLTRRRAGRQTRRASRPAEARPGRARRSRSGRARRHQDPGPRRGTRLPFHPA